MENSYGIGITNRYALFYNEDEDPFEILKSQERELEKKKKAAKLEKENRETTGKPNTPPARKGIKDTQNIKPEETARTKDDDSKAKVTRPQNDKTIKFSATESREERNNRRNRENKTPAVGNELKEIRDRDTAPRLAGSDGEGRGRGRGGFRGGRGRGRGGRGGGGFDMRGKREFDRQSGSDKRPFSSSGVKPVDKRDGGGAHNWGTYKEDVDDQLNTTNLSEEADNWGDRTDKDTAENVDSLSRPKEAGANTEAPENEEPAPQVEEGPREMTLDEYRAMQGERMKPVFNIRRPGDGEDTKQWKKTYALKKKPLEENYDDESDDDGEYHHRAGRQKQILSIDIQFSDSRRGGRGRGRGGRGRGRGEARDRDDFHSEEGGGSVRGPFGPRRAAGPRNQARPPRQVAPKVDDENDFPSLG